MKRLWVIGLIVLMGCSSGSAVNFPKTTINGATIGGGSSYCIFLSAFVGALGGGTVGTLLANNQGSTGTSTVAWGTMATALGSGLGGLTGYGLCAPTPAATPASESLAA
jgi:hypothetical protein